MDEDLFFSAMRREEAGLWGAGSAALSRPSSDHHAYRFVHGNSSQYFRGSTFREIAVHSGVEGNNLEMKIRSPHQFTKNAGNSMKSLAKDLRALRKH